MKIALLSLLFVSSIATAATYSIDCGKTSEVEADLEKQGFELIIYGRDSITAVKGKQPVWGLYGQHNTGAFVNVHLYPDEEVMCIMGNGMLIKKKGASL